MNTANTLFLNSNTFLNLFYLVMMLAAIIGGIAAFRDALRKTRRDIERSTMEAQERANNAMQQEINTMKDKISDLERENTRLSQTLGLIKSALRKRGLTISIDGDLVTIESSNGTMQTGHIQGA